MEAWCVTSSSEREPGPCNAMQHYTSQETGCSRRQPIAFARLNRSLLGVLRSEALKSCLESVNRTAATLSWQDFMTKRSDVPFVPDSLPFEQTHDRSLNEKMALCVARTAVLSFQPYPVL
jgi:hypothetical protein